jgi:serine/threonine protein kinase
MGEVYRARDRRLNRTVAIKILPPEFAANPVRRQRLHTEARAISSVSHPHICAIHDIGHQDGLDFIVMEHLEGETLAERLRKGALPIEEALSTAIQIAGALAAAHERDVVHRDVKPGNVMLTRSGAKLVDFGLAKLGLTAPEQDVATETGTDAPLTAPGTVLGTLPYMAPEQIEGRQADRRSDVFSPIRPLRSSHQMVDGSPTTRGNSVPAGRHHAEMGRDGKEIFYLSEDHHTVFSAEVAATEDGFVTTKTTRLFRTRAITGVGYPYDVSADGQRFLFITTSGETTSPLSLVTNWRAGITR